MSTVLKACADCGELSTSTRCDEHADHRRDHRRDLTTHEWRKLARRAKQQQTFCLLCGATRDLTADHSPRAWARLAASLPLRLADVAVLCRTCNTQAGSSQPGSPRYDTWHLLDGDPRATRPDPTLTPRGGDPKNLPPQPSTRRSLPLKAPLAASEGLGVVRVQGETPKARRTPVEGRRAPLLGEVLP